MRLFVNLIFALMLGGFSFTALADDNGGGGGTGGGGNGGGTGGGGGAKPEHVMITREELDRLVEQAAKGKKDGGEGGGGTGGKGKKDGEEGDLGDKVRQQREEEARRKGETSKLEGALRFNLSSDRFISENKDVLPKDIVDIFGAAEKETYDSEVDKANAVKAAVVKSFFDVQANLDLLTSSHKAEIESYNKLSKNAREERAEDVYRNIFEPALARLKDVKKAEEVARSKSGYTSGSDADKAYREKLVSGSRKHYLGDK